MIDTHQRQTVAGCGSVGVVVVRELERRGGWQGGADLQRQDWSWRQDSGCGVRCVCVCAGGCRGVWMMVVLRGFSQCCICDPVLSARSVVKAWRIRPPRLPHP